MELGAPAEVDGAPHDAGGVVACVFGTRLDVAQDPLQVLLAPGAHGLASTAADDGAPLDALPSAARLSFLPRGARLFLADRHGERGVYLPERRAELCAILLSPPEPLAAGELVDDETVLERLWPRQTKTVNDVHVLVHRLRKSLVAAGIDGARLIERAPRAGGTRFALRPGAEVIVE